MKTTLQAQRAFSLLELLVVITIIAILASVSMPAYTKVIEKARMTKDVSNQKQIVTTLRIYAFDNDGVFPNTDFSSDGGGGGESSKFSTSTDAFQHLIEETDLGTEEIFYTQGNPTKLTPPNGDGFLEPEENCMSYVVGLTDTSPSGSPVVADEMEGGTYGDNHPWLRSKRAIVGYVGGHVKIEKLNQNTSGATVRGPAGSGIEDIFQPGEQDEEGKITGGMLPSSLSTDSVIDPQ